MAAAEAGVRVAAAGVGATSAPEISGRTEVAAAAVVVGAAEVSFSIVVRELR